MAFRVEVEAQSYEPTAPFKSIVLGKAASWASWASSEPGSLLRAADALAIARTCLAVDDLARARRSLELKMLLAGPAWVTLLERERLSSFRVAPARVQAQPLHVGHCNNTQQLLVSTVE